MTEIISMNQVVVGRPGRPSVLSIDAFRVMRGELVALVGPNGAGKSTLLRTINLLHPYQGELCLFGERVEPGNQDPLRRRGSMVFQDALLLGGTVRENVAWPLKFRGLSGEGIRARVDKALADFGCGHLADRQAKALSGGESQRVCIARAFVAEPELILLDEPFASLDVAVRTAMIEDIRVAAKSRGVTVLMVSHNYSDVLYFAERAVAIFDGKIRQDGSPQDLMRRPADEQVARLAGIDNILPCRLDGDGERTVLLPGGVQVPLLAGMAGIPAFCCLPGDVLEFCGTERSVEPGDGRVLVKGTVDRVVPAIGMCRVLFRTGDMLWSARLPRSREVEGLQPGTAVCFRFHPRDVQFV